MDIVDDTTPTVGSFASRPHAPPGVLVRNRKPQCRSPPRYPQGGSVSYAAVAARALGARGCVVTVSGPQRAQQLDVFDGHALTVLPSNVTLTFAHTYRWWGEQPARLLRVV